MSMSLSDRITLALVPLLARLIIRSLHLTMRISYVGFDGYRRRIESGSRIILAFWHGRLLMMPYSYPGRGITILVSQSKDGELVSRTVKGFGIDSVRGSSSKGWFTGLKGLLKSVQAGRDVAITPDGPRGPGSKAQMGAVQIARATGLPIFPMAFGASRVKKFRSWDSFVLPYPFTRGVFICGEPISVAKDAGADDMEAARSRLEDVLNDLTERADRYFSGI